jgi:tRNA-dihydrouridine synthase A
MTKEGKPASRKAVLEAYLPYVEKEFSKGTPATILTRHLYGLFTGLPGARKFRQVLSQEAPKTKDAAGMLRQAMDLVVED